MGTTDGNRYADQRGKAPTRSAKGRLEAEALPSVEAILRAHRRSPAGRVSIVPSHKRTSAHPTLIAAGAFCAIALLIACSGRTGVAPVAPLRGATADEAHLLSSLHRHRITNTPIQHVVIIIQENRSFDNLFNGYPGANTVQSGLAIPVGASGTPIPNATPTTIPLQSLSLATTWDIDHRIADFENACDGSGAIPGTNCRMDGFSKEYPKCYHPRCTAPSPATYPEYSYVPQSETGPYWSAASQYVLADNMFASNIDASFVAHQYLIAGWANHAVNYQRGSTWGCGNPQPLRSLTQKRKIGPWEAGCFTYGTLATELEAAGFDWRYYAGGKGTGTGYLWSAFAASSAVYNGPDWSKVISPPSQVLTDAANGNLVTGVTWVAPTLANSDHADSDSTTGPSWVASVVNAIGQNPALWNTTAIFIVWDDWGGWYDHVAPQMLDFDGLGFRVPMIVVSPYARRGYVTHVQYEFGSILKFAENNFGVGPVAPATCCYGQPGSDTRANDPTGDVFNFSATPRPFATISATHGQRYFLNQPADDRPVDRD